MQTIRAKNRIGIDAVILAVYFAITPVHQTLFLPGGRTVAKYLAFAVMIAVVGLAFLQKGKIVFGRELWNSLLCIAGWLGFGILYSQARSTTVSNLISIFSYFAFMLIVCSKEWTTAEKHLFKMALIGACIYYSITLIEMVAVLRRASFVVETGDGSELKADQNIMAINIGLGAMFALSYFLTAKRFWTKLLALATVLLILAGVFCTGSRGALIAIVAAMLFYLFSYGHASKKMKWLGILFIGLALAGILILLNTDILGNEYVISRFSSSYEGDFFSGRPEIWRKYLAILNNQPSGWVIGYGFGTSAKAYGNFYATRWPRATHNDLIQLIFCGGIIAVVLFALFIRVVWRKAGARKDALGKALILLVLIGGLTVDSFQKYGWWNAMIFANMGIGITGGKPDIKSS